MGVCTTERLKDTSVDRDEVRQSSGKLIKVKWVYVNKGDNENRTYRSRLVGQEFKTGTDDTLYAATPPLEKLRLIVSRAATVDEEEEDNEEPHTRTQRTR